MIHSLPFLVRTARPILKRGVYWAIALVLAAFPTWMDTRDQGIAVLWFWIYGMVCTGLTFRRLDDDQSSGTMEQLEMLPLPRWRIALETAAGALIGFAPFLALTCAGSMIRPESHYA